MAAKKVILKDYLGNPEYPQTTADMVAIEGDPDNATVQQMLTALKAAIDELYAASWNVVDNPEFVFVLADNDGRILLAVKADGSVEWSAGVPNPIRDYIGQLLEDYAATVDGEINALDERLTTVEEELSGIYPNVVELVYIDQDYDKVVAYLQNGQYGLNYRNPVKLIYKDENGVVTDTSTKSVLVQNTYHYGGIYFNLVNDKNYHFLQMVEVDKKPSYERRYGSKIPYLATMPDYSDESWDLTKHAEGDYTISTIMQQTYAYIDALCLEYPNLLKKYDPMASESVVEGGITIGTLPEIKAYMAAHGFDDYPFWCNGLTAGQYTVDGYTADMPSLPAFKTYVYKLSTSDGSGTPNPDGTGMRTNDAWFAQRPASQRVNKRVLFIQAGIHGHEDMGMITASHLVKELLTGTDAVFTILANYDVYIIPVLDGYNAMTWAYDGAYGTNGNRNYPTPWWRVDGNGDGRDNWGHTPGSYFPTRLSCAFVDTLNPDVAFDIHDQTGDVYQLGYYSTGLTKVSLVMYNAWAAAASTIYNTPRFEQYFGTKQQIPRFQNRLEIKNAAHATDYFYYKDIRCGGLLELPGGINYVGQPDGTAIYARTPANDYSADAIALAALLTVDYTFIACEYNLNNF